MGYTIILGCRPCNNNQLLNKAINEPDIKITVFEKCCVCFCYNCVSFGTQNPLKVVKDCHNFMLFSFIICIFYGQTALLLEKNVRWKQPNFNFEHLVTNSSLVWHVWNPPVMSAGSIVLTLWDLEESIPLILKLF